MSTYRDRREAKAERLRSWADKREAKATAEFAKGDLREESSGIPFGQPILVGHHSERRHHNAIDKAHSATRRSIEHADKAREMRERAANIEAAAAGAIYSDDEDAAGLLRARISDLEAKRDAMKAANAAFRAKHKDALKAMTPFERGRAVPHPPYELTNLGGNLSRQRARLAAMQAASTPEGTP